ncbi:MGDG synthase family glycosyltransferase [Clostridium akagii]|uniref:MGDG synthase family glycosyltransferase n=1 Tax=Clostridium akagii TaxID=91623 RepID=UPI00047DB122|nr:glycosyltransferase [Clostridium akagii]
MRALILSVSAGGGHIQASLALKNYIMQFEPTSDIEILDTIKYINPLLDKLIIGSYLQTVKMTPSIFGKIYKFTEKDEGLNSVTNKFNELMAYKLLPIIDNYKPDIIICTHPFPTQMVSILKQKKKLNIPMICILTDYAPHNTWIHPKVDSYIVSNSDMKEEMTLRGVDKDSVFDFGIPVSSDFFLKYDKSQILAELNLDPLKKTIMIMGGSLGIGKIARVYSQLSKLTTNVQIIVIAGSNKKLYSQLMNLKEHSTVTTSILGFSKNINKYMQCSDLLITKPGGLTITEALICNVPLALFSAIPGQEKKNEEFLLRHKLAITLEDGTNCKEIIENLMSSPKQLQEMKENCRKYSKPSCGRDIFNLINVLIKKREIAVTKKD